MAPAHMPSGTVKRRAFNARPRRLPKGPGRGGPIGETATIGTPHVTEDPMSEDELIERATSDRIAGRETDRQVDALLWVAAETNRAALDRLAR